MLDGQQFCYFSGVVCISSTVWNEHGSWSQIVVVTGCVCAAVPFSAVFGIFIGILCFDFSFIGIEHQCTNWSNTMVILFDGYLFVDKSMNIFRATNSVYLFCLIFSVNWSDCTSKFWEKRRKKQHMKQQQQQQLVERIIKILIVKRQCFHCFWNIRKRKRCEASVRRSRKKRRRVKNKIKNSVFIYLGAQVNCIFVLCSSYLHTKWNCLCLMANSICDRIEAGTALSSLLHWMNVAQLNIWWVSIHNLFQLEKKERKTRHKRYILKIEAVSCPKFHKTIHDTYWHA